MQLVIALLFYLSRSFSKASQPSSESTALNLVLPSNLLNVHSAPSS